ncbi:biotin--[acetyl-CoA-carboxylase] ligase [Azoarcus sp. L1K30]|uniref:biotin--[acetyl-CoA-carboxylase] ligase n=1 Tax=Azoarcus sp. L1K30 TaxID=2820277 RepID=UPI002011135D|nr:biotin--[acetyl-CoA-carboxylase] ligase [Azoarcus sp. L1K30]
MSSFPAPPPFDLTAVSTALGPLASAFSLRWLETCASTNAELMTHTPADDGQVHVLIAGAQTAGRGRRGRQWQSWPGHSLTFSALWRFDPGVPAPAGLSLVVGLALAITLEKLGVHGVQLKWPNDVLVHGRKLAGILIELLPGRGPTPAAVIGIGINLQLPPDVSIPEQAGVTDLAAELGTPPRQETMLAAVLGELHKLLDTYAAAGFDALRGAWQQRNAFAGLPVRISGEGKDITGICLGADEDGALLIRTDHEVSRILSGEVSLRPVT